jgi:hypothetical protein
VFDIAVCEPRRIVLIRFTGVLAESDFAALEVSARGTPAAEQYDCVFDFSGVQAVELATDFVSRRGDLPKAFQHRDRVYVVPHHDLKLLMRLYAAYQTSKGWREPTVVNELGAALAQLGVSEADFRRYPERPREKQTGTAPSVTTN